MPFSTNMVHFTYACRKIFATSGFNFGTSLWATSQTNSRSTPLSPQFPKRYEVRPYPDGSRAVVAWDLEALEVWYKRVLRG